MKGFTKEQANELRMKVAEGSTDSKLFKKVQAIYWRAIGRKTDEVAELSGLSASTIKRACAAYRHGGIQALETQYVGSNNRKLSYDEEAEVLQKLSGGANVGKYVRAKELLEQFKAIAGVSYQLDAFYRLLWRHGWRKVMPRGQHPKKANDEAIEASKKLT